MCFPSLQLVTFSPGLASLALSFGKRKSHSELGEQLAAQLKKHKTKHNVSTQGIDPFQKRVFLLLLVS